MVRETRHLWVGNLPDNIREDRIREHFKRYGRVQSVKLLPRCTEEKTGEITMACTVAFMDIKSASKAHNAELKIDDRTLTTEYYEPAAIPSAALPQNTTPSPYSTSPGATRFPNGHGSSDEHGTFPERFYERSTPRLAASEGEFIRRGTTATGTSYHDANRGRNRDRTYRNGPYNTALTDRHSRTPNAAWPYDSNRYNNTTTGNSQSDTGYSTTPSENNERRNSDQSTKKKTKSRSGSGSPSPSGSTSSRSPSRSRSRSSSSSSSSSTSRDTSSTGSPKSRRLAATNSNHQPVVHSDDRRPLAICVKNLPVRSSDTSLKDGLFHEYKKHGKVTWVKVVGKDAERHAIVCFKKPEDVEKAIEVSYDKLFFGCKIEVAPYQGYDVEDNDLRPYEAEIDEFHPKATRTLFIGNLEKDVTASDLRKHFDQFGEIIEIDIKKQGAVSSYAFCQYTDIVSVVKAIRKMDGEHLGNNRIKLGFGKSMPYNCVWVDGVNESVNEKYLKMQFDPFGVINKVHIDREKGQALIFYEQALNAQAAVNKMRGFNLKTNKIQVDFASRECQEAFFERIEKQGAILDRSSFEERRDTTTARTFDAATATRFSRFDTPTRPRTSSYSSRSSAATSQVTSAMQSPGTPGSVTPRGSSSRSRSARFADYYDQTLDYTDRHFRSYDEYSQGSAASHEDVYEHEYAFAHDSPTHLDPLQAIVDPVAPFAPPDMRNLQKERVHLLEQLEECPSSGDELMSPKKRLKLDLLDSAITSDVIIEANREHRKVMEVRRLSDVSLKHHSRRPSVDSGKHLRHDVAYLPHAVCKRRKTAGSDSGSKVQHYDHSGSESVGGSRPGTPLCDERPENFQHTEPRRVPREREGPLTLPLPRFAAQIINRGSVSVAGIKGQKDNVLSSPPPAVTSPRISNPRPPSPVHVPPPASPPPRPPSLSSNSSDSDITPPSPSLEERIKSLDEKYEKWSGSRGLSAAGGDALAMLDANLEKFRQRHKILDLDLKEVQPSEIVKSVMAKRSVFDEDLKRLENVGEKYEPKEFSLFPRSTIITQTTVSTTPLPALKLAPVTQLPKTPTTLSPRSAGTSLPAAKGLQYPFPTHPPILMSPIPPHPQTPPMPTTPTPTLMITSTPSTTVATTVTTARGTCHGENRLKPCPSVPSDTRTSSKMNVNKSTVVCSSLKICEKTNVNIPNANDSGATSEKSKCVRDTKSSDKITSRRDSNSNSPRADIKTRRNSDTSARRIDDCDSTNSHKERAQSEERKRERFEKIKTENEKLEKEKTERERIERERLEHEKQEKIRLEKERLEKERLERESELEKQRLEKERLEKERLEREQQEKERAEKEKLRLEKEHLEREREKAAQKERERLEKEKQERLEKERLDRERREKEERERREQEQQEREKLEKEKKEREQRERDELARKEREEKERREREEQERRVRDEQERKEREERERRELEKYEKDKLDKDKHERERKREEEHCRHKDENHDRRKDDHKHRDSHGDSKHRENNIHKHSDNKSNKESSREEKTARDMNHISSRDSHDSRSNHSNLDKNKLHFNEREAERRKESLKENRDNNVHDKHKSNNESSSRGIVESRHMSIDLDKNKSTSDKSDPTKRKERNNSLPANISSKRRLSSHHETLETSEENKKLKLSHDHKKLSERRDSKDSSRSEDRLKSSKHKNNVSKSHDKHNNSKEFEEKRKEKEERHKKHKLEKQKSKSKSREKDSHESPSTPKSPLTDKEFLNRLDLRCSNEIDKHQKEFKEKRKDSISEEHNKCKKEKTDKIHTSDKCRTEEGDIMMSKSGDERKKRERIRKLTNSSDTDSDEPKKHSIFDIVDDEPAYISMYDKVKARSCKNMAKLEEEKRQEKLKAKFNQLKQSRAKREEKKRSTSWDEDSDSEKDSNEMKVKRCPKMLIDSTDDESQERKSMKKKDIYSDSDCSSILKHIKQEPLDTSDDEFKHRNLLTKAIKSRITSDTLEDEYNKKKMQTQIKVEPFSDVGKTEMQDYIENDEKSQMTKIKDELDRLTKKERRNSKHQDSFHEVYSHLFSDISQSEMKTEKFNNVHSFVDNTSDEDNHEFNKKERSERREKKHRKKQKKQKHSLDAEEEKIENISVPVQSENAEKIKHEKKKEHSKKEKRRDKTREGREKSKKSKKSKPETKSDVKRDGKMENIFGSLSEDSENGNKDIEQQHKPKVSVEEEILRNKTYTSDPEKETENKIKEKAERDREREEHHKRKKEKKRREKERRLQEAAVPAVTLENASNENSMDFADMGKQLEANMMQDESLDATERIMKDIDNSNFESEDSFRFSETPDTPEVKKEKEDKKEIKEKKKKRKRSKDEKSKHHHHHHHDKNKSKTPEVKKEISQTEHVKEEIQEATPTQPQNPSLPTILDENSPVNNKNLTPDFSISPMNPIISPIPKTPTTSKDKKRDKFLPGFGTEIDETIHDTAVKSISEFESTPKKEDAVTEEDAQSEKTSPLPEEKPRVVISQEETEDAVAALLGESFGGGKVDEFYNDDSNINDPPPLVEESNVQDDEEMRQAVQSLSASDLDVKPETPQSEHELQIDTDTEEQEDIPVRFDASSKTPEREQSPKTPNIPPYYSKTSNISSPPSLTPIRPAIPAEVRKSLDLEQKSLPVLPEQTQRTVISQSWTREKNQDIPLAKPQPSVITIETKKVPVPPLSEPQHLKITEQYPPLKALSKTDHSSLASTTESIKMQAVPHVQTPAKSPNPPQLHNLPARSPVQMNKLQMSVSESGMLSPKLPSGVIQNRLPITPVMSSKPMQATTVILQQAKVAHPLEPPKLVATSDQRPHQDRPRPVFQTSSIQPPQFGNFTATPPRMMMNMRHLPPQGLLVPTRQLTAPHNFGYLGNMPHSAYSVSPISKENPSENILDTGHLDPTYKLKQSSPPPLTVASSQTMPSKVVVPPTVPHNLSVPLTIPKELSGVPCTPALTSPRSLASSPSPKPFMPMCSSPKPPTALTTLSPKPVLSGLNTNTVYAAHLSPKNQSNSPVSSAPETTVQTNVIQSAPKAEHLPTVSALKTSEPQQMNVISEPKTSTPNPVIVSVPVSTQKVDNTTVAKPREVMIPDMAETETESKEQPIKLAIEKVTDELNSYLEKASPEIKEDGPIKHEEIPEEKPVVKLEEKLKANSESDRLENQQIVEVKQEIMPEISVPSQTDKEIVSVKETDKFDEDKTETESILSDVSKGRSASADILVKDDPLDTKEDSDYWSAKEVNIDSVIKTLCSADELSDHSSENGKDDWFDNNKPNESVKSETTEKALTLENKEQQVSTESRNDEFAPSKNDASMESKHDESVESKNDESMGSKNEESMEIKHDESVESRNDESLEEKIDDELQDETAEPEEPKEIGRGNNRGRGGRRGRGKSRGGSTDRGGIQTRRGKLTKDPVASAVQNKRGRGGRTRNDRKTTKSEPQTTPTDVYEFRDESDDANKEQRPRLILTIKSPAVANSNNSQTTAIIKEVTKDGAKEIGKEETHVSPVKPLESKEEFTPPAAANTRKSRRLQEKDICRNTVDDTIEDVVKNTIQTRAASNQRRSTRQAAPKQTPVPVEVPRKSPRGRKGRRGSEATETSSSEETPREEMKSTPPPVLDVEKPTENAKIIETTVTEVEKAEHPTESVKGKPHECFKTAVLRRHKGDLGNRNPNEATNLIDPVTGELIPMRESEEGKYVPLPGSKESNQEVTDLKETPSPQPSVIAQPQQVAVVQQPKVQSFKAHVLSSQAAQAVVSQPPTPAQAKSSTGGPVPQPSLGIGSKNTPQVMAVAPMVISKSPSVSVPKTATPIIFTKTVTPIVVSKSSTPVIISKPVTPISQHLSINTSLGMGAVTSTNLSPRPNVPSSIASKPIPTLVKPPPLSPVLLTNQQKQQLLQVTKQQVNKNHMVSPMVNQAQMVNTQMAHVKHQPVMKQQVIMGKGTMVKPMHQQQILTGAVASPPLSKSQSVLSNPSRIIHGPPPMTKGVMEPPKVEVSLSNTILGQRPKLSPQGPQQRLVGQTGLPVPGYEATLHGERSLLNRSRSPPPAHQNSPSPKGEAIAHFPPGPLRPPPEISPAHYMHPSHVIQYQQYLRQQQLHLTRTGGVEKVGDGQEGEEAPVSSPPLELRKMGSVGLSLAGRGAAVPHSLHSPHDRATDSPQVGQVYNVLPTRLHYHSNRYHYEQTEPPPAHRPLTSHGSLAALGSDRGLAHMSPLGTPDRPLSGHSALTAHMGGLATPDRPISSHVERPVSAHGLMSAGLGAAGNLMGAVARHIGADAPTSQRGLQAATPPHASQVPPQAESLFMLLKQYPCMWQGLLALKNDQAAVQMYFVSGNDDVAKCSLPKNTDGSTPPLRIFQRMRLEPPQVEGVARKMQMENEHCMLLALPCGHDHMDVLKQSTNLTSGFITYLQQKQAAGIVNVAAPGTTQPPAYVVHIFPSCDFVNENLRRIAPSLLERVADIAHLLIVITTV